MESFGRLLNITASSMLLLDINDRKTIISRSNSEIDKINFEYLIKEFNYLESIKLKLSQKLRNKKLAVKISEESPEETRKRLYKALALVLSKRSNIAIVDESSSSDTSMFDDLFGDAQEQTSNTEDVFNDFGDIFGDDSDEPLTEMNMSAGIEKEKLELTLSNLNDITVDATHPLHFEWSLLNANSIITSIEDEIDTFKYDNIFTRAKKAVDTSIAEAITGSRIFNRLNNENAKMLLLKASERPSIFNETYDDISRLVEQLGSAGCFNDKTMEDIDTSAYPVDVQELGDNIVAKIYLELKGHNGNSSLQELRKSCQLKSNKNNYNRVLGIPVNTLFFVLQGKSYINFTKEVTSKIDSSNRSNQTSLINYFIDNIKYYIDYINSIYPDLDDEFDLFKYNMLNYYRDGNPIVDDDIRNYMKYLDSMKLAKNSKYFSKKEDELDNYIKVLYNTYKLYTICNKFSLDYLNNLLDDIWFEHPYIDMDKFILINKYIRDVYSVIPLTLDNLVLERVVATSKTSTVVDDKLYTSVLPNINLLLESLNSRLKISELGSNAGITVF